MHDQRFARQLVLAGFGAQGQRRLAAARVVVVGAGGIGCALIPVLAAAGVGELVIVDDDLVETSNLHRQTLYRPADVGQPKAQVAAARVTAFGGAAIATTERVTAVNAFALLAGATLVIDATDDVDARYALDDAAASAGIPLVWGSAIGFTGQVGVSSPAGPRWRDLFPSRPRAADLDTCATAGVLPSLCTTVGGAMATETFKLLAGFGRPLIGRLLVFDAASASVREIAYGAADEHTGNEEQVATIEELSAAQVAELMEGGADVTLIDVREPWEAEIATLPGATLIPLGELAARIGEVPTNGTVIAYCHGGVRSLQAAEVLQRGGVTAKSMAGGIDAWSRTVDPTVPRY